MLLFFSFDINMSFKIKDFVVIMNRRTNQQDSGTITETENGDYGTFVYVKNPKGEKVQIGPNSDWQILNVLGGRRRNPIKKNKSIRRKLIKKKSVRRKVR